MGHKLNPLGDRVLVKIDEAEETHGSGIIVKVQSAKEAPKRGTVVALGPGMLDTNGKLHEPRVNIGDRVMFAMYSGQVIEVNHENFLILKDGDILGTLEEC
jgi:chaperonin GroES